ncbi:MAG: hypothetical protein ABL894_11785 [Hyphomicrobium sp.]
MPVIGKSAFDENSPGMPGHAPTLAPLGDLLLARIACDGGATRSEIATDLSTYLTHKLSPGEWRRTAESQIAMAIAAGLATETRNRLRLTSAGRQKAANFTGLSAAAAPEWAAMRDIHLIAKGLGIERESASRLKMAVRPEGLRALIVQTAYKLPTKKNPSLAKLRAQLARVALERAFGNSIKTGFGNGAAFTSKAGRSLAGQLSNNPRDFATDQRLITALAAEAVGAVQSDFEALQLAICRNLGTGLLAAQPASDSATGASSKSRPATAVPNVPRYAANDAGPRQTERPQAPRPDPGTFATAIKSAASKHAEGWPGNRKAFISQVWQAIRISQPAWDLTEIEFKCMLAEAHRLGQVVLATADLKDKKSMAAIESSAIAYKNTVWHFVRVEEN